jgi:hypothetical protein
VGVLLTFVILIFFNWQKPLPIMAATKQVIIYPNSVTFTSSNTTRTMRRFIAIGNFYDTTNSAYFNNSIATMQFHISYNQFATLKSLKLQMYKYANAYSGTVRVDIYKATTKIGSVLADNGDLDFDLLQLDLTKYIKTNPADLTLTLKVNNPASKQGIAVCSGNIIDSICKQQYKPRLLMSYTENQVGTLKIMSTTSAKILMIGYHDNYSDCAETSGCNVDLDLNYQDIDRNAIVKVSLVNSYNKILTTISYSDYGQLHRLMFRSIKAGNYHFLLNITDGAGNQQSKSIGNFLVDVIRPIPPVVVTHSSFISTQGAYFNVAKNLDYKSLYYQICLDQQCASPILKLNSTMHSIWLKPKLSMHDGRKYYFQINGIDIAGNFSQPTMITLTYHQDAGVIQSINLTNRRISPRNQDGKYDSARVNFTATKMTSVYTISIKDAKGRIVNITNRDRITGRDIAGRFLKDANYYLEIKAKDELGQLLISPLKVRITVDNTAPMLE